MNLVKLELTQIHYYWWLRSDCSSDDNGVGDIDGFGCASGIFYDSYGGVVPVCVI